IHRSFVTSCILIFRIRLIILLAWGQAGKIQVQPPQQKLFFSFWRWRTTHLFLLGKNKEIYFVLCYLCVCRFRWGNCRIRWYVSPMFLPHGPLIYPISNELYFLLAKWLVV